VNVADFRSEPWTQFLQTARDGLALTLVGRDEPRPPTSRRRERLATAVAVLGVVVIGLSMAVLVVGRLGGHGDARGSLFIGLFMVAARFRLAAWRLGLLAALALSYVNSTETAGAVEFMALVALFCVAATVSPRIVVWWMCVLMLAVLWITMPVGVGNAIGVTGLIVAAAVAMDAIRGWQQTREALEVETEHAEREQARRGVLEERSRIGRELHDVVAYHMSLIAVQAETAPYRVGEIPESVSSEFTGISAAARAALGEMRRLLGPVMDGLAATAEILGGGSSPSRRRRPMSAGS
jgi:signal transduction histidine kinase